MKKSKRKRDRDDHRDAEREQPQFERRQPAAGVGVIGDRHGQSRPLWHSRFSLIAPARNGSGCRKTIRRITARDKPFSTSMEESDLQAYSLVFHHEFVLLGDELPNAADPLCAIRNTGFSLVPPSRAKAPTKAWARRCVPERSPQQATCRRQGQGSPLCESLSTMLTVRGTRTGRSGRVRRSTSAKIMPAKHPLRRYGEVIHPDSSRAPRTRLPMCPGCTT